MPEEALTLIEAAGVRNAFIPPTALRMLKTVTDNLAAGPYMLGERFSAADVLWGTALGWTTRFGLVPHSPVVDAYVARIDARPAAVRTRGKETELAAAQGK